MTSALDEGEYSASCPNRFNPQGKSFRYPLGMSLGRSQSQSGRCGEEKNCSWRESNQARGPSVYRLLTPTVSCNILVYSYENSAKYFAGRIYILRSHRSCWIYDLTKLQSVSNYTLNNSWEHGDSRYSRSRLPREGGEGIASNNSRNHAVGSCFALLYKLCMKQFHPPPFLSQLINPLQGKAARPPQWLEFTRIEERII
jgi:hypothetical protein